MAVSEFNTTPIDEIHLGPETESSRGWHYTARIEWAEYPQTEHKVSLSHQDCNLWCGGRERPSEVALRGIRIAACVLGLTVPGRFDLSQLRMLIPDFDQQMTCDVADE